VSFVAVYGTTVNGHAVELEFDQSKIVLNKATLRVDGQDVRAEHIFYGERELSTSLSDGTSIEVAVHSGMVGELTRAQVRTGENSWVDLVRR
jgi:hypothetical protein